MTDIDHAARSESVPVSLGDRSYDISIGEGLLARAGGIVAPLLRRPMTAIVTDSNVAAAHLATRERALAAHGIRSTAIIMPPGEATKSYQHLAELCDRLLAAVQIEDAETGVSQADVSVEVDPELVGAAVTDRPEHAAEGAPVGRRRPMQVAESDDAAHQRDPEAAVVWLSLPGRSATWSHPCLR